MKYVSTEALRLLSFLVLALGAVSALAGLFWVVEEAAHAPELYGRGLYRRDTDVVAGGAQGSDLLGLLIILPLGLWATMDPRVR